MPDESSHPRPLSRRDWLRSLIKPKVAEPAPGPTTARVAPPASPESPVTHGPNLAQVAVIAGRFCLAYQHSFCTTCSERCPEPGAIVIEQGLPRIVPEACTGCGICHEVCPAPEENAVRILPRKSPPSPKP